MPAGNHNLELQIDTCSPTSRSHRARSTSYPCRTSIEEEGPTAFKNARYASAITHSAAGGAPETRIDPLPAFLRLSTLARKRSASLSRRGGPRLRWWRYATNGYSNAIRGFQLALSKPPSGGSDNGQD